MAACYGAGALSSLLLARLSGRLALGVGHLAAFAGAVAGLGIALGVLLGAPGRTLTQPLPILFPFARLSLSVDGLSAYFLFVISLVAVAAALYGPAYLRAHSPDAGPARQAAQGFALNVFLGSMAFVCCADDALTFLFCWEGMTLASYVLVVSDDRDGENARAGLLYMVMAHGGTALLLVAFLILTERSGAFDFMALRAAARDLDPATRTTLFFLAFSGFAAKAGVVPLHVWLPRAHPAAPSHVSALMSGVMLKVAIYGILRFAFDLLAPVAGPLPFSWGWIVLFVGTISAVLGVLYALQQHDLKRLLAFHSVENIGIILIGVGLAMILWRQEGVGGALATVALTAALLHTVNHAAFKGLLFLGAGSVLCRTHVRNMEELGGLARRMPWTAGLFLLGAIAISALPPLNGFVSEWLTFQALLGSASRFHGPAGLVIVFAAAMLALTGGLAAACFVKAFGVTFLGRPRTSHAEHATEAPPSMIAAMVWLGAVCVALGVAPGYAMPLLDAPTATLLHGPVASAVVTARGPLVLSTALMPSGADATAISMTMVAALLLSLTAIAWILRRGLQPALHRAAPTWTCGMKPTSRFDYTATAFAKPLRLVFEALYHPRREVTRETAGTPYVLRRIHYAGEVVDLAETQVYHRVEREISALSQAIRARSTGRIYGYIGFVLGALFVALLLSELGR
ncbi:MAG: hydrogenase 4 subunit B [Acidobacteria bacterium RIFCSPLOWO2_02_FULL_65_29]|nr:MAG: hydrogenase 4 subunit B [Acidobacteria bacterium RIFCSPLOWO2_02_FULL_65_29]